MNPFCDPAILVLGVIVFSLGGTALIAVAFLTGAPFPQRHWAGNGVLVKGLPRHIPGAPAIREQLVEFDGEEFIRREYLDGDILFVEWTAVRKC